MDKQSKHGNILAYKILSIGLPFFLFLLLEIALRLFNYGTTFDVFVPYDVGGQYLMFSQGASQKYFNNAQFATTGNQELFKKDKDPTSFRIFVLGESTTIGYPYFHNGSFHRWLQYRLMRNFPEKNFEIINLSLTAVNSFTVLGFSKKILDYEPDAVLIYTGHNEYYGAMGVASTQLMGSYPRIVNLALDLRKLRTVQLMIKGYQKLQKEINGNNINPNSTRMELMVAERHVPLKSKLYEKGIQQFQSNMDETLALFNSRNIPVFLGNLVSNEKDLMPFISTSEDKIPQEFTENFDLGEQALKNNDSLAALTNFNKANEIFPEHAKCNYYLGMLNYGQKKYNRAKIFFEKAKEMDELRFRAPEKINKIVADLANRYSNTHLIDVKKEFENHSFSQIIGDELIIDHVHPNLNGFALMSKAFYDAIHKSAILPSRKEPEMSFGELLKQMPISTVDSLVGEYRIHNLKASWPYNDTAQKEKIVDATYEEKLAVKLLNNEISWRQANDSLYTFYNQTRQPEKARKISEALVLEYAEDPVFYDKAGSLSANSGKLDKAVFYFAKSFDLRPSYEKAKYLFTLYLRMDKPSEAMPYLDFGIANGAEKEKLMPIRAFSEKIIVLKRALKENASDLPTRNQIAKTYFQMGNANASLKYVESVLNVDPQNKQASAIYDMLKPINSDG